MEKSNPTPLLNTEEKEEFENLEEDKDGKVNSIDKYLV